MNEPAPKIPTVRIDLLFVTLVAAGLCTNALTFLLFLLLTKSGLLRDLIDWSLAPPQLFH